MEVEDVAWGVLKALPFVAATGAAGYFYYKATKLQGGCINDCHDKDAKCVVTSVAAGDLGEQAYFCRCWKSQKFPYCDGSHKKHNESAGDNVGPLLVKKK